MLINSLTSEIRRNLEKAQNQLLPDILARISSGKKIKYLSDNPIASAKGLLINLDIKGVDAGIDNLNSALDFLNIADAGVQSISRSLLDMQELADKAANPLATNEERKAYDAQFQQKIEDIFRVTESAVFMGQPVLTGVLDGLSIQIGPSVNDIVTFSIGNFTIGEEGINVANLALWDEDEDFAKELLEYTLKSMPGVLAVFNSRAARLGTRGSGFLNLLENQKGLSESLKESKSRIYDIDLAQEQVSLTTVQMMMNASLAALSYANDIQAKALSNLLGINW